MRQPKKVLIICYYWPPAGGPGVQRWLKFVKYLPDFKVTPIVYVPENPSYPITDEGLLSQVPENIQVLKQPIKEPYGVAGMLSRKHTKSISAGIVPHQKKQNLLQKLMLYVRGNYFIPDARIGWVKPSITYLENVLTSQGIDTIITTGPPHSLHLIGLGLKERLPELEWMADFRDPWTSIGYHDKLKMTKKTKAKHKDIEREVLQSADKVIVTSPRTKKEFSKITTQPITVITNGYDIAENQKIELNNNFTVSHIGSLLSDRNPKILWSALSAIVTTNKAFRDCFRLSLSGRVSETVLESIAVYGLEGYVQLEGYVSHQKAIQLQREANVLLLIEIDSQATKAIIPGKLFEYLAARRPILAIGPEDSDIQSIIENTSSGNYFTYTQEDAIRELLLQHFNRYQKGTAQLQTGSIQQYHRKELTKTLAYTILS